MSRNWRNTIAVLGVTVFTALVIASGVEATTLVLGDSATGVVVAQAEGSSTGTLTCPATGCTASSCHATSGGGASGGRGASWN